MTILLNLLRTLYFPNYSFPIVTFSGSSSNKPNFSMSNLTYLNVIKNIRCCYQILVVNKPHHVKFYLFYFMRSIFTNSNFI